MTEDEAKTKWCPFARVAFVRREPEGEGWRTNSGEPVWNVARVSKGGAEFREPCVASACMAWRTRHMPKEHRAAMFRDERRLHPALTDDQLWSRVNSFDLPDGYCGLAGAPQ